MSEGERPDDRSDVPEGRFGAYRDRGERLLARLVDASATERIAISAAALVASLLVGGGIVLGAGLVSDCGRGFLIGGDAVVLPFAGTVATLPVVEAVVPGVGRLCYNPAAVYYQLFVSPFLACGTGGLLLGCSIEWFTFALTLKETTLLLFTGLSVAVAFRAGLFNIGTQGQLVLGGLATALSVLWIAPYVPGGSVGTLVLIPVGLSAGAVVGGLYGALPGALKAYADANEVITTIMLNFVAINVALYLVATHFQAPDSQSVETASLPVHAQLAPLLPSFGGASFSTIALVGALTLVAGVYYLLWYTSFGYDLRTGGLQPAAAAYGGVNARRMIITSMTLSGALGGLGGAVYVMMVLGRWRTGVPAIGFDGITVSILAGNHPLGVALAAILFGTLKAGSLNIQFALGVPKQLVGVLRGLVILFVAMPEFFRMLGRRWGVTDSGGRSAVAADGGRPADNTNAGRTAEAHDANDTGGPEGTTPRGGAGNPGGERGG